MMTSAVVHTGVRIAVVLYCLTCLNIVLSICLKWDFGETAAAFLSGKPSPGL
jgi:hypothetical protein